MPPSLAGYARASPPSQKHGLGGAWAKTGCGEAGLTGDAITSSPVQSMVGIVYVSIARVPSSLLQPSVHGVRYAAWRYTSPVASKAHSIRACLFARATAATWVPRRALSCGSQTLRVSFFPSHRRMTAMAPWSKSRRRYGLPRLLTPPSLVLPPVPCCVGTNPSQAAQWRPFLKAPGSWTAATHAVAVSGPTPSTALSRCQTSNCWASCPIRALSRVIAVSRVHTRCYTSQSRSRQRSLSPWSASSTIMGMALRMRPIPWGTTHPYSPSKPRS